MHLFGKNDMNIQINWDFSDHRACGAEIEVNALLTNSLLPVSM